MLRHPSSWGDCSLCKIVTGALSFTKRPHRRLVGLLNKQHIHILYWPLNLLRSEVSRSASQVESFAGASR